MREQSLHVVGVEERGLFDQSARPAALRTRTDWDGAQRRVSA
jgi:hypothetical protein